MTFKKISSFHFEVGFAHFRYFTSTFLFINKYMSIILKYRFLDYIDWKSVPYDLYDCSKLICRQTILFEVYKLLTKDLIRM